MVELMVTLVITLILLALVLSVLQNARDQGNKAACLSNLRQIGVGINLYAAEHGGEIPYGPKAGPYTSPGNFYPSTGSPTSLLSVPGGAPVALGFILPYLGENPEVLFCPGSDQPVNAATELAKVGVTQAQGSYYYRHGGNTELFDSPNLQKPPMLLGALGLNRNGIPIRALVIDTLFSAPKSLESFNVKSRGHHRSVFANILFADGHVASRLNAQNRFSVDVTNVANVRQSFDKILQVFEQADMEY